MTNVTSTQEPDESGPESRGAARVVLLDSVVPPVLSTWRMTLVILLIIALGTVAWLGHNQGGYAPNLVFGHQFSDYGGRPVLSLRGDLESRGVLPVTITGVDAAAPGLGDPRVSFSTASGAPLHLPFRLRQGEEVTLSISWRRVDCARIHPDERYFLPVSYTDVVGLSGTVEVAPLWWVHSQPGFTQGPVPSGPVGVGWQTGISWVVCGHPFSSAPSPQAAYG